MLQCLELTLTPTLIIFALSVLGCCVNVTNAYAMFMQNFEGVDQQLMQY